MSKLPDFVIPGFQKSGTTALRHNLGSHSCVNSLGGERDFFSTYGGSTYDGGFSKYKSKFPDNGKLNFDKSPNIAAPGNAKGMRRMYEVLPDVKLLFMLRNPVDRAFSAWNHYMQNLPRSTKWGAWEPDKSFSHNARKYNKWVDHGCYMDILQVLLDLGYSKEQCLFVIQEEHLADPDTSFARILDFLELPYESIVNETVHERPKPYLMGDSICAYLQDYYKLHNERLFEFLGREVASW
jgi:hypothetical protein